MLVFSIIHLIPGDPVEVIAGPGATVADIERLRVQLGLDKPIHIQFFIWLGNVLHGDLGRSIITGRSVLGDVLPRFWATLELATTALIIAITIGVTAGIIASAKQYSIFDRAIMLTSTLGVSMPVFWLGLMLILLFSVTMNWLPSGGKGGIENLILPSLTLAAFSTAEIARMTRSSLLEVIRQNYIRTARAKGCPEPRVLFKHALKNALIPVVTIIGLQYGYLLAGTVITETVFAWPGVGRLMVDSIMFRDFPMVQGCVLLIATTFVFVNLVTDILYLYIDPRIHYK